MDVKLNQVAQFQIGHLSFLDHTANITQPLPEFAQDEKAMLALYRMMVMIRTFDQKAIALQRTGKMGTYPATLGQEAISVAVGSAMREEDVLCPYYREIGAQFWRGVKPEEILLYWGGEEAGSCFEHCKEDMPIAVPIASQVLYAAGIALAFQIRKQPRVVVTSIGDGGTSKGDFYEAINFAGVRSLPIVFVVNNNQWAISVPLKEQTATQTIAQKAIAGEVKSLQVDGNDVIAMRYAMSEAVEYARLGKGPTVIEALTYRMCDHTTADDAKRYRPAEEIEQHKKNDPIHRTRQFLANQGWWNEEKEKNLIIECQAEIQKAAERYLAILPRAPESMFDCLYETLPYAYESQREEVKRFGGKHG